MSATCGADMGGIWLPDAGQLIYRPLNCNLPADHPHALGHRYFDQRSGKTVVPHLQGPATVLVDDRGCVKAVTPPTRKHP